MANEEENLMILQKKELYRIAWNSILEKLTVSQLVKKFVAFYGTQRFIIVVTRARHLSIAG
jgi:hypothetical protein